MDFELFKRFLLRTMAEDLYCMQLLQAPHRHHRHHRHLELQTLFIRGDF